MESTVRRGIVLAVSIGLLAAPTVFAQISETDQLQQIRADMAADRQALVTANLELTDEEGAKFWPLYREYRGDMMKVGDRLQKLVQEYAVIYDSATEEQAEAMLDEFFEIQHDQLKVRTSYLSKFREVLSQVKVTRLYQVENKYDAANMLELAAGVPLLEAAD